MKVINYAIVKATLEPIRIVAWEYDEPGKLKTVKGNDGKVYTPDDVWSQSKKDYYDIVESQADGSFDPEPWTATRDHEFAKARAKRKKH